MRLEECLKTAVVGRGNQHPGYVSKRIRAPFTRALFAAVSIPILLAVVGVSFGKAETAREYIGPTCSEISAKFSPGTEISDIQMNEFLQNYKGKWVKWVGAVAGVSETLWGVDVSIRCTQGAGAANATISFDSSWKPSIMQLKGGQQIQFAGQLEGYGELGGILIKEGELASKGESVAHLGSPSVQPSGQSGVAQIPSQPEPKADPAPPSSQAIQIPSLSIGDEFVIEHKNMTNPKLSYVGERRVVSLDGNRVRITSRNLNSDYVRTLDYDRQWNIIASRGRSGEGLDYSPPIKYYDFPLYPGKRWSGSSTERNIKTGLTREHTIFAEVGGWETVTVPAGTFRAIKVIIRNEVRDSQTSQVISGTDISWYAPSAKRSVKSELTAFNARDGRDDVQVAQLIRYSVK